MRIAARSLVLVVLAVAGARLPAVALRRSPAPHTRVVVLDGPDLTAPEGVALPFPATHIGVRWRGSAAAPVGWRARTPGGRWTTWRPLRVDDDVTGQLPPPDVASALVRPPPGARRVAVRVAGTTREVHPGMASGSPMPSVPGNVPAAGGFRLVVIDAGRDPEMVAAPAPAESSSALRAAPEATEPVSTGRRAVGMPGRAAVGVSARRARSAPGEPPVVSRAQWGADERLRRGRPRFAPITKLIVHHTYTPNDDPDPAQTVRAIYAYHTRANHWDDIGYNFLIDAAGRVYEGRFARRYPPGEAPTGEDDAGRGVIGAHARAFNPGSVGVALLGDFSGSVSPTPAALDSLVKLLAWKAGRHGIDPFGQSAYVAADGSRHTFPDIAGHRDVNRTACPGQRLYDRLPEVRRQVAELLGEPGAAPPQPQPAPPPQPTPPQPTPRPPAPVPPVPVLPPVPVPPVPGFVSAAVTGRSGPAVAAARPSSTLVVLSIR